MFLNHILIDESIKYCYLPSPSSRISSVRPVIGLGLYSFGIRIVFLLLSLQHKLTGPVRDDPCLSSDRQGTLLRKNGRADAFAETQEK
jgi:hypothetical protein